MRHPRAHRAQIRAVFAHLLIHTARWRRESNRHRRFQYGVDAHPNRQPEKELRAVELVHTTKHKIVDSHSNQRIVRMLTARAVKRTFGVDWGLLCMN